MALTVMGVPKPGARLRALTVVLAALVAALVPHRWSSAGPGDGTPAVVITAPPKDHVFEPGEDVVVGGTATDDQGVLGIKLEYWLLNKLVAEAIADCDCGAATVSWGHSPQLDPGYYVVAARAVDLVGTHSPYASRGFATGLEQVPPPPNVSAPDLPNPDDLPSDVQPPEIESPEPGELIPGAEQPVPIEGGGEPGETITVSDEEHGQLAEVETDEDGRWTARLRLPSGTYSVSAQATDADGNLSPPSQIISFDIDSSRPIAVFSEDDRVFLPTQPVVVDGTARDDRGVGSVFVEYWLWGERVQTALATCGTCGTTEATWSHRPSLADPGQYIVRAIVYDVAGNPSHTKTMTVTTTGLSL